MDGFTKGLLWSALIIGLGLLLVLGPGQDEAAAACRAEGGSPVWVRGVVWRKYQGCAEAPRRTP